MTGNLKLSPFEILLRLGPLSALQSLAFAAFNGEAGLLWQKCTEEPLPFSRITLALLAINCCLAFAQNVSSFYANKIAGPLTITVCANLKQGMTILTAIVIFHLKVGLWSAVGMMLTLSGVFWYSWIDFRAKDSGAPLIPR